MVRLFCLLLTLAASAHAATYVLHTGGTTNSDFLGQTAGSTWSLSVVFDPANLSIFAGASYEADAPGELEAVFTIGALTGTASVGGNFYVSDATTSGVDEWYLNLYPFFPGAGGPYWLEIVLQGGPDVWSSTALPLDSSVFPQLTLLRRMELIDSCFSCTPALTRGTVGPVTIAEIPEPASVALAGLGLAFVVVRRWRRG
ncbi:MAG: PEP-CTERM sorting domain-containing protein [Bryobacterales bacterium]|nr:PEP-CTERM sorting domain-containing protein [Bryobacterales bacterium]